MRRFISLFEIISSTLLLPYSSPLLLRSGAIAAFSGELREIRRG
jgi:hypothetical protein